MNKEERYYPGESYPGQYAKGRERALRILRRNTPYTVKTETNGFIHINRPDVKEALKLAVPHYIRV